MRQTGYKEGVLMKWVALIFILFTISYAASERALPDDEKPVSVLSEKPVCIAAPRKGEQKPSVPQPTSLYLVSAGVAGLAVLSARKIRK